MPTVRIKEDLYSRVTKLAVQMTIETQNPTKQSEIIHYLLERILDDHTARELIKEYHELVQKKKAG